MSHYSNSPNKCRVDFFKSSGKWYTTVEVEFGDMDYSIDIFKAFKTALKFSVGDNYKGMTAICLEPYHENSHPLSIIWNG